jgi:hypothetical protein
MENRNEDKSMKYHRTNANEKTDNYGFIFVTPAFKNSEYEHFIDFWLFGLGGNFRDVSMLGSVLHERTGSR